MLLLVQWFLLSNWLLSSSTSCWSPPCSQPASELPVLQSKLQNAGFSAQTRGQCSSSDAMKVAPYWLTVFLVEKIVVVVLWVQEISVTLSVRLRKGKTRNLEPKVQHVLKEVSNVVAKWDHAILGWILS